ncbi:hypothetical protein PYCCODRAFT_1470346 [Trametes coccinea BRFM310]|uniref:DUF6534 domain-containing protein n=1 Tax=Trametes coccinea (strain BRFM310) TaxID=1353009 RepID=A0A1Y2IDR0_TRAC3|nr:hypothetical protein PYCCODRAFT_1470346 [Trametes coccinea BRFM310]
MASTSESSSSSTSVVSTEDFLHYLIIGFAFSAVLYGITIMQAYVYYRRYPKDDLWLKIFIALLLIIDTLTTAFAGQGLHTYAVDDYLQPDKLDTIVWSLIVEDYLCIVAAVLVQFYFAQRLWILSHGNWLLTGMIAILALISLATGTWICTDMFMGPSISLYATVAARVLAAICSGSRALADVLISGGLCYYLHTSRTGLKQSDTLIDKLMMYAIQRGLVTTICQGFDFITILAFPTSLIYLPVILILSKLYIIALLATLNVRKSLNPATAGTTNVIELESMPAFARAPETVATVHDSEMMRSRGLIPMHSRSSVIAFDVKDPDLMDETNKDKPILPT